MFYNSWLTGSIFQYFSIHFNFFFLSSDSIVVQPTEPIKLWLIISPVRSLVWILKHWFKPSTCCVDYIVSMWIEENYGHKRKLHPLPIEKLEELNHVIEIWLCYYWVRRQCITSKLNSDILDPIYLASLFIALFNNLKLL